MVKDHQLGIVGKACSPDLIDLASACEEGRIGAVSAPKNDLNHPGTCRLGKRLNLIEIGRLLAANLERDDHRLGMLGGGRLRGGGETREVAQAPASGVKFTARDGTMVEIACL